MIKKAIRLFILTALIFVTCCLSAKSQFYTIRAKEPEKAEVAEKIVADSQTVVKEVDAVRSVVDNSEPDDGTKLMLDGMRKRQYLSLPVDELKINSPYGYRNDPVTGKRRFHNGVDLEADFNYVYSIMPGRVVKSGRNRMLGEFVQVEHGEFISTYGHLLQRLVAAKDVVEAGQPIGISGSTGRSTGEHLHFGMSFDGKNIDPQPILNYIMSITQEARKELENAVNQFAVPKHQ
ncbi:MAG: M23 family metallopeptidase [Prevotellaceae bacterium]|jgi:murein DD-endopeptidase MepM/ murein hydrolase activator NlpD|nr:M23 family metallopeptidase [Prevotellaceae bacterium]